MPAEIVTTLTKLHLEGAFYSFAMVPMWCDIFARAMQDIRDRVFVALSTPPTFTTACAAILLEGNLPKALLILMMIVWIAAFQV